jgi:putative lipoprotein
MRKATVAAAAIVAVLATVSRAQATEDAWWGRDKALHFGVSAGLGAAGYGLSSLVLEPRWQRAAAGAGFSLTLGAAKELADMHGSGTASGRDMAWNAIGTATGVGLAWLVDILLSARRTEPQPGARAAAVGIPGPPW